MQAVWNFSMTAPASQTVLFNMPHRYSESAGGGNARNVFQLTPPMSSYLVAVIVGNLPKVSRDVAYPNGQGNPRPVSIWGTPDRRALLSCPAFLV